MAAGASRDTPGVVGLEPQEGSAAGFIANTGLPVADGVAGVAGGRSQRGEVLLSKHSRSSSEKGSATSEPSRRPSAERHCRKDLLSNSDSS
ncbi:Centrosomal protein of 78 kDa [Apodemus speciosus]|uniref:Centrosomal protein of 78 kDa n=1 Tax=Apodemus speciosus TaxID=105296 RepID=A0ABQ0FSM9_APOSI